MLGEWEYFVVNNLGEDAANELGQGGWELVSVHRSPVVNQLQGWFKRARDWND